MDPNKDKNIGASQDPQATAATSSNGVVDFTATPAASSRAVSTPEPTSTVSPASDISSDSVLPADTAEPKSTTPEPPSDSANNITGESPYAVGNASGVVSPTLIGVSESEESSDLAANSSKVAESESSEETTDPSKPEVNEVSPEELKEKEFIEKINAGSGINLVPTLSKGEQKVIQKKSRFNFAAAFFILLLVVVSIAVVGFNILTKFQLRTENAQVRELEAEIVDRGDIVRSNNELLDRISLYKNVQQSTLSPKEILVYWKDLTADYGQIQEVEMQGGVDFTFRGTSSSLNDVAILWHKLSIDDRVLNINLESVGKSESGEITYNFEGELNSEYFSSENVNQ